MVSILHLVHARHRRGDKTTGGIPLDISCHKVLDARHGFHGFYVEELKLTVHRLQTRQDDDAPIRTPEQMVGRLILDGTNQRAVVVTLLILHAVERDIRTRTVAVNDGKAMALRLPRKRDNLLSLVGEFNNFHWAVWFAQAEQLETTIRRLPRLGRP